MIPWFVFLIPAAFVALGGVFALKSVSLRRQGRACAQWPVASGRILEAHAEVKFVENDNDRRHRDDQFFGATVSYAYQVGGRDYRSTRLYVGRPVFGGSPKFAQDITTKYPSGASVPVFYNPANPAEAMLEPLNFANAKLALMVAVGFGGLGLLAMLLMSQMSVA
jgi:Protein of unknown function (DUF3592)